MSDPRFRPLLRRSRSGGSSAFLLAAGSALAVSLGCGGAPGVTASHPADQPSSADEQGALVPIQGFTVGSALGPQQSHAYTLELLGDELVALSARQRGVDVVLEIRGPQNEILTQADSPTGTSGHERALVVSTARGTYHIVVSGFGTSSGSYALSLDTLRPATVADRRLASAVVALNRAELLRLNGPEASCREAEPLYRQALAALTGNGGDLEWKARALHGLGSCVGEIGDPEEAAALLDEASVCFGEAGLLEARAWALRDLGRMLRRVSNPRRARHAFDRSVALFRELSQPTGEAAALLGRGELAASTAEFEEARTDLARSLEVARLARSAAGEAAALSALGRLYTLIGYTDEALDYLARAEVFQRRSGDAAGRIGTLTAIGWVHYLDLDPIDSLPYYAQALALAQDRGDLGSEAGVLDRVGSACRKLGFYDESEGAYRRSADLSRKLKRPVAEGSTLANLGRLMLARGDPAAAVPLLDESISRLHNAGDRNGVLAPLLDRARADRLLGDPDIALARLEVILKELDTLRDDLRGDSSRALFLATRHDAVDETVDVLFDLYEQRRDSSYLMRALEINEHARARGLLDGLVGAGLGMRATDPAAATHYRELSRRLESADLARSALMRGQADPASLAAADSRVRMLSLELERARAELQPAVESLTAQPLSAAEIQSLAEPDTTLLIYALAESRSFLWVVRPQGVEGHILPRRATVEALARSAVAALEASQGALLRDQANLAAAALGEAILAPAAGSLTAHRLVFLPDGALHTVPFAALPSPSSPASAAADRPLIADHEIVVLPSASVLALQRRLLASRPPAPLALAVVADPVFGVDDPRLHGKTSGGRLESAPAQPSDAQLSRAANDVNLTGLKRLPHSRDEAAALASLVPERERLVALGFDASRETVTSGVLSRFRMVHIATHGFLNTIHPDLSGIVLSLYDQAGRPRDGFVRAHELRELDLSADLVVLSACRTGLGRTIVGEGVLGVTRGLLLAGARRVIVSSWDVDDEATSELMVRFYRGMLRRGLPPAAALRAAQLSMLDDSAWSAPANWAAFSLHGDWR